MLLKPKILADPDADLERALAEADEDIKTGRVYGPYDGEREALTGLRYAIKEEQRRAKKL